MQLKLIKSLNEVKHLVNDKPTFTDIETEGLYTATRLIQVYQPEIDPIIYIIDTDIVDLSEAKDWLSQQWLVFHNASYDLGTLNIVPKKIDDTFYLSRTAYPEWMKYSLDSVVSNLGLYGLYAEFEKKDMQKAGFIKGAYLSQKQIKYAATDVVALAHIWQNKKIQATREVLAYKVDILSLSYSIKYQQNTLISSQENVRKELDKIEDKIEANYELLNGLNPNSPKQVKEYLNIDSSAKDVLIKLITTDNSRSRMAKLVYDQRRLLKRRTFLNSYNHPYVVTRFNPAGAATGRFTSTGGDLKLGINAQQIPRDLQYIFNQDTKDTTVVHADYSTAELRAGCSIMRDAGMYEELKAGKDLHRIAATLALGGNPEDISKADRQKGKAISFGFIFGMSAPSFVEYAFINYGVKFTQEEAKQIKTKYQRKYPSIAKYAQARWNDYKSDFVKSPLGRRNQARMGTDAINYATQSCIAETTKLAIHYLVKEHPKALQYIYNVVHDAIYARVPKDEGDIWADRVAIAMKKGWVEICKRPLLYYKDIPMPVEVEWDNKVKEY